MGTIYNTARGVQFFAPFVVSYFVAAYGLAGGLGVPLVLALGDGDVGVDAARDAAPEPGGDRECRPMAGFRPRAHGLLARSCRAVTACAA